MNHDAAEPVPVTVAISGAGGTVGYGLVFRIAAGALFGAEQSVNLRLLEQPWRMPLIQATSMELDDGTFPLLHSHLVTDDPHEAFAGADWIILLAGSPRDVPAPARTELLKRNGSIYVEHGRAINGASPSARILVVAAPCNANCMVAMNHAADVPREHWFAMNRLDRMRATGLLARRAKVPVTQVSRVTTWGNHSDLVFTDVHNALIDGKPAHDIIANPQWIRAALQDFVRHRSAEIFKRRPTSPAGTACQAILGTIRSLTTPTPLHQFVDAAVASDGSYGVPRGLVFGFPLRTDDGHTWSIEQDLYLDEFAQEQLALNIAQLEQEAVMAERWFG